MYRSTQNDNKFKDIRNDHPSTALPIGGCRTILVTARPAGFSQKLGCPDVVISTKIKFDLYLPAAFKDAPVIEVVNHGRDCSRHLQQQHQIHQHSRVLILLATIANARIKIWLQAKQLLKIYFPDHLNWIRSGMIRHASSLKEEEGGEENGLLKLTKDPVSAPDTPVEDED